MTYEEAFFDELEKIAAEKRVSREEPFHIKHPLMTRIIPYTAAGAALGAIPAIGLKNPALALLTVPAGMFLGELAGIGARSSDAVSYGSRKKLEDNKA